MYKKRIGVFETNSSSSHTISWNPWRDGQDGNDFLDEGDIIITGGEFGWGWDAGNGSTMKANYVATQYKDNPEILEKLRQVITGWTGRPTKIMIDMDEVYIDHQSMGILELEDEEDIKNFVFNPDVWLYIGNDNSEYPTGYDDEENQRIYESECVEAILEVPGISARKFTFVGYPLEEGEVVQKIGSDEIRVDGDWYYLKEFDLVKLEFVFEQQTWQDYPFPLKTLIGHITSISSGRYGKIL